ncbi:MAG: LysR substrate-binding domain-containing protein [Bacteroidales bacterium]|nr:LysR substrate-binding domain-containing protein [Bacteroidales bacterium]
MTIQQLEYIVALERHAHFQQAAESCGITQPTLSATIAKLEEELDTQIFDRSQHPIKPTEAGSKVIHQAKIILREVATLKEIVRSERERETGSLNLGIITTIAPYILPKFIRFMMDNYPNIELHIKELPPVDIAKMLAKGEIDIALMSQFALTDNMLTIPIYHERFVAYVSPDEPLHSLKEIHSNELAKGKAWLLNDDLCTTIQLKNIGNIATDHYNIYRADSVGTLIRIVDENGGFAVIPEFHIRLLKDYQIPNIRPIITPNLTREVDLVIRKDFVQEKLLNIIAEGIRKTIPDHVVIPHIKEHTIKI